MHSRKLFISCGELSGETHASRVVIEIFKENPDCQIQAFGSSILKELGVNVVVDYANASFSGISEVIANLPKILAVNNKVLDKIIEFEPDIVLLVDYGAFNIELAKKINKAFAGKKNRPLIFQYIAPQIWASRPHRVFKIKKYVDKVFCTLPFEKEIYDKHEVRSRYVGNPVASTISKAITKQQFFETFPDLYPQYKEKISERPNVLVGLFPGSRKAEIKYMLPIMLKSAAKLQEAFPEIEFVFVLARATSISLKCLEQNGLHFHEGNIYAECKKSQIKIRILNPDRKLNTNHKLLSAADFLWLCSGTVTLEASFYQKPYFLAYKSTLLNFLIYKLFKTIDMAGLANIIAGKYICKEFLQYDVTVDNFFEESAKWIKKVNGKKVEFSYYYRDQKKQLQDVTDKLTEKEAPKLVAEEILALQK